MIFPIDIKIRALNKENQYTEFKVQKMIHVLTKEEHKRPKEKYLGDNIDIIV